MHTLKRACASFAFTGVGERLKTNQECKLAEMSLIGLLKDKTGSETSENIFNKAALLELVL